jgi:hypothetical protein
MIRNVHWHYLVYRILSMCYPMITDEIWTLVDKRTIDPIPVINSFVYSTGGGPLIGNERIEPSLFTYSNSSDIHLTLFNIFSCSDRSSF